jgi:hypothetical protein
MWMPVADAWQIESGALVLALEPRRSPRPWRLVVYRGEQAICSRPLLADTLDDAMREALDAVGDFSRDFVGEVNALALLSRRSGRPTDRPEAP